MRRSAPAPIDNRLFIEFERQPTEGDNWKECQSSQTMDVNDAQAVTGSDGKVDAQGMKEIDSVADGSKKNDKRNAQSLADHRLWLKQNIGNEAYGGQTDERVAQ